MRRSVMSVSCVVATAAVLAGCSSGGDSSPAAVTTVVTVTRSTPPTTTSSTPTTATTTTTRAAYSRTSTQVSGRTDRAVYDVTIPQLAGGDPAVTAEFNRSMRAALQDQINSDYTRSFVLSDSNRRGPFHIGSRVISAEQITDWIADPPGAHGDALIATVTIATDTATPVTLSDAFSDLGTGLRRLSEESARLLPSTAVGSSYESSGITPEEKNFANWTASPEGMRIHFSDYQVGAYADGLITITIPWSNLSDVLAPGMQDVLSS